MLLVLINRICYLPECPACAYITWKIKVRKVLKTNIFILKNYSIIIHYAAIQTNQLNCSNINFSYR